MDNETLVKETGLLKIHDISVSKDYLNACPVKKISKGQIFYKVGDMADTVYIIKKGKVQIFITDSRGEELILSLRKEKGFFGENAIIYHNGMKRLSNARAFEDCEYIMLPQEELYKSLRSDKEITKLKQERGPDYVFQQLEQNFQYLQKSKLDFSSIQEKTRAFKDRQVIFFQNDKPDYAYLIMNGEVDIWSKQENGKEGVNIILGQGEIFGELGVLNGNSRNAMAVSRGNSELMLINKETLLRLCGSNTNFKNIISSLGNVYNVPLLGKARRYEGDFLGMPAICIKMESFKQKSFLSYQVVGKDIFCFSVLDIEGYQSYSFIKNTDERMEIWIKDDVLVGLVNYGSVDDGSSIVQMILHMTKINSNAISHFEKTGKLTDIVVQPLKVIKGTICQCMQVSYQTVNDTIKTGESSLSQIVKITGAGSVCGSCKPRIQELLGYDVWKLCKLTRIIKHNEKIWSFQYSPINPAEKLSFLPGQYVVLRCLIHKEWIERPYTLTSHPNDDFYEVTIKKEERGALSRWLFENAYEGMINHISEPQGNFIFDNPLEKPVIIFAGGIGITPAIIMAKMIKGSYHNGIYVDYSYRFENDAITRDFFDSACDKSSKFQIKYRNTSSKGRISSDEIAEPIRTFKNADIYICGPVAYNENVKKMLVEKHTVPTGRIFVENFSYIGGPERKPV